MPHDALIVHEEAASSEQAVLGTLLQFPERIDEIAEKLQPGDFVEGLHAGIFEAMLARHAAGEQVSLSGIAARLGERDVGEQLTLRQYLAHLLAQHASPVQSLSGHARAVRDAAGMRELQALSQELQAQLACGGIVDPVPIAGEMVSRLDTVIAAGMADSARPMSMGYASRMVLQRMHDIRAGKAEPGISYGIPKLDRMTNGGMLDGQLIILGGRPGMGKSALGISIGLTAARHDVAVYCGTLEMSAVDLAERALSAECYRLGKEVPYKDIAQATNLTREQVAAVELAQARLDSLPFHIEQRSGLTVAQLAAGARRYFARERERGRKRGLMVIDYLGLVRASDRYRGQRVQEVGEVTRFLKALAKELGVPIVLLCQLNRGVEHRDDKHPVMADLRDSGDIEQDADVVLFAYRDEYYLNMIDPNTLPDEEQKEYMARQLKNEKVLEIGVVKQRKGETGWIRAFCDIGCNIVDELRETA